MRKKVESACADCDIPLRERICTSPGGKGSKGCPTVLKGELIEKARREYRKRKVHEFARQASIQEGECYIDRDRKPYRLHPAKPRILEICEFAKKMGYRKLGLVFCGGLAREAAT
ncbi:MAG TPA: DUF1847 domain-containing protein, partial [Syntrophorhabdaceae bacterium]|nr:DUF1847 domain-containing protein [Syntrophorhabdaceae bacterium]